MHQYTVVSGACSLVLGTEKTLVQVITGSTRKLRVFRVDLSFSSTTSSEAPVLLRVLTQTTAGTVSAATPAAITQSDPAAIFTAGVNATVEPTAGTTLVRHRITPVGGFVSYDFGGAPIELSVSTRVGFALTAGAAQSNVEMTVWCQE